MGAWQLPYAECDGLDHLRIFEAGNFKYRDGVAASSHVFLIADTSVHGMVLWIVTHVWKAIWTDGVGRQGSDGNPCDGVQIGLCCWANGHGAE